MGMILIKNSESFNKNPEIVKKTMKKEDRGQPCHFSGHPYLPIVTIFEAHNANHGNQRMQKPMSML